MKKVLTVDLDGKKFVVMAVAEDGSHEVLANHEITKSHYEQDTIVLIQNTIEGIIVDNPKFESIVLKKVADKGKFMPSPLTFKIQALAQLMALVDKVPIVFIAPQTINTQLKKNPYKSDVKFKYMDTAYKLGKTYFLAS